MRKKKTCNFYPSLIMSALLQRERNLIHHIKAIDNAKDDFELQIEIDSAMEYINRLEFR